MVPQISKRRKLASDASMSEASDESGSDEPVSAPPSASNTAAATASQKEPVAGTKRPREQSASAPYAGESYKSSFFKLQVDEMLAEVRPDYAKRFGPVDSALRKLKSLIESIPERGPLPFYDASKRILKAHKIAVPFPEPKPDSNTAYKLAYAAPSDINVMGSYPLKTMTKADHVLNVDLVVTMPASILQEKDYLNHRYFYKRAYYLACIAAGLQEAEEESFDLSFENLHGNDLQPVLVVKSGKGSKATDYSKSRCEIRIIPGCPEGYFADSKLQPAKNAIRPKDVAANETSGLPPTPFYNASLKAESNYRGYLKLLYQTSKKSEGFIDACILGRIWLRQRGFGSALSEGGFGHCEWAILTALLLQGGGPKGHSVLSPAYSSYQLFKGMVQYLSANNLAAKPMLYQASDVAIPKSRLPTFYDGQKGHNVLFKMSASSYEMLQEEARVSLAMLNDETFDQFDATFILKKDNPLQQFDSIIKLDSSNISSGISSDDHRSRDWIIASKLHEVLKEALMDRAELIHTKTAEYGRWALKSSQPSAPADLLVGIVYNPEHAHRAVDHGPPADDKKAAAKFRKFWGEKSELRRFRDGSILESLVWTKNALASIPEQIIAYILYRHFGVNPNSDLSFIGNEFESLLPESEDTSVAFPSLREEFRVLENNIRGLEELPLQLKQVSAIGAQLRSSSLEAPVFSPRSPLKTPADILISFEGSGRWPDDVVAIQRTKIAFLLHIGELLDEAGHGYRSSLGLENENHSLLNCAFLDIIAPSGASFRMRIHNDREATLLEGQVKAKDIEGHKREAAVAALALYKYMFVQLPLHTQSVGTHCTRFPLLTPTIRLVKKWFASHLLSNHIREEFIELLVMRIFLQPYPWRAPSSAMTGFLRTLQFIAKWDWRSTPLVVDFSGSMTSKDVGSISTRLEAWRRLDPGMNKTVVFAASNHDGSGTAFTDGMPSKVVAARMTALARSACSKLKDEGLELDAKALFVPSLAEYDFVIHLSPKFVGGRRGKGDKKGPQFKNLEVQSEEDLMLVGYNPVRQFVDELNALYTTSMVLFYSDATGHVIAGLWSPTTAKRGFKVNIPFATKPVDGEEVVLAKESIISEISRLGGDMISKVEMRR